MKKKIAVTLLILIVLIAICSVVYGVVKARGSSNANTDTIEQQIVKLKTYDELKKIVKDNSLDVHYSEDDGVVSIAGFNFWDSSCEMTVFLDSAESIQMISLYFQKSNVLENTFDGDTNEYIYMLCSKTINQFAKIFNRQNTTQLQLSNYDGSFSVVEKPDDIEGFINGQSYIEFSIRDQEGYYYVMQLSIFDSVLDVEIQKFFDVGKYIDYVANISLYEEKE